MMARTVVGERPASLRSRTSRRTSAGRILRTTIPPSKGLMWLSMCPLYATYVLAELVALTWTSQSRR